METQSRDFAMGDESRGKRRASEDEWTANKKRALSSTSGSPVAANGVLDDTYRSISRDSKTVDEPEKEDDLERFRKAAIFRRMRHYQREQSRAHERISHLEASLRLANLERIESDSCWSNIMDAIQRLTQLETLLGEAGEDIKFVFPSRIFSPEDFDRAKHSSEEKIKAANKAIKAFVQYAGKVERPKYEELFSEYQDLQQSNSFLAAEAEQTYVLLEDTRRERDRYLGELRTVTTKFDRLQSRILNPELNFEQNPTALKANGEVKMDMETGDDVTKMESMPIAGPQLNSVNGCQHDEEEWQARLDLKDSRISELELQNASIRDTLTMNVSEMNLLSEETIALTPAYKLILDRASKLEAMLRKAKLSVSKAEGEVAMVHHLANTWQENVESSDAKELIELKFLLKKRDDDLNRIRQSRDSIEAQLKEVTATHDIKRASLIRLKDLTTAQEARIETLTSEVKRLQCRLAAADGNEDLLNFLQKTTDIEVDYVRNVTERLKTTEKELDSLRSTLHGADRQLIDAASLRRKLESANKQLENYRATSEGKLAEQLEAKDEEIRIMKLKESQGATEMDFLVSEIDRMTVAWEELKEKLQNELVSIEKWEEEKEKLILAKQKSDNKYFKVMADQESKDSERKQAVRYVEKQGKQIEAMINIEKELRSAIDIYVNEVAALKSTQAILRSDLDHVAKINGELKLHLTEANDRNKELQKQMKHREVEVAEINLQSSKLKDEFLKVKKEAERATEKAKALTMPTAPASVREAKLQKEIDRCMKILKCSTCHNAFRNTVITKCMHSFCKGCVDARISHRSRKCPACNLVFSQSDVQTLYLQ